MSREEILTGLVTTCCHCRKPLIPRAISVPHKKKIIVEIVAWLHKGNLLISCTENVDLTKGFLAEPVPEGCLLVFEQKDVK